MFSGFVQSIFFSGEMTSSLLSVKAGSLGALASYNALSFSEPSLFLVLSFGEVSWAEAAREFSFV